MKIFYELLSKDNEVLGGVLSSNDIPTQINIIRPGILGKLRALILNDNGEITMTYDNQQFIYDNLDNPDYAEVEECLRETDIEDIEKDIRSDIDRVAGAFMDYMEYANKEEIPMDVADALWALVESGLAFRFEDRHKPINIVVNAATRWKAEELYGKEN